MINNTINQYIKVRQMKIISRTDFVLVSIINTHTDLTILFRTRRMLSSHWGYEIERRKPASSCFLIPFLSLSDLLGRRRLGCCLIGCMDGLVGSLWTIRSVSRPGMSSYVHAKVSINSWSKHTRARTLPETRQVLMASILHHCNCTLPEWFLRRKNLVRYKWKRVISPNNESSWSWNCLQDAYVPNLICIDSMRERVVSQDKAICSS